MSVKFSLFSHMDQHNINREVVSRKSPGIRKKILALLSIILVAVILSHWFELPISEIRQMLIDLRSGFGWEVAIVGVIVYAILLSIPFFPGVELGWLIILLFGKNAVILVYLFTLIGLTLSFLFGRWIGKICQYCQLKLDRFAVAYNESFNQLTERIHFLLSKRTCNLLLNRLLQKSQYLILAILINVPGNSIIGGGGGIALLSGMNRSISLKGFLLTLIVAVLPLPLMLYFGLVQVENLLP